jgi:hypothetical protein
LLLPPTIDRTFWHKPSAACNQKPHPSESQGGRGQRARSADLVTDASCGSRRREDTRGRAFGETESPERASVGPATRGGSQWWTMQPARPVVSRRALKRLAAPTMRHQLPQKCSLDAAEARPSAL